MNLIFMQHSKYKVSNKKKKTLVATTLDALLI